MDKSSDKSPAKSGPFLTDVTELRRRARQHIENGAVTEGYKADKEVVVKLLNEALATEIVCVLRYKRHYFMAQGPSSKGIADEFLEHANEEQVHADQLAERITQLNGEPNFSPEGMLTRSHSEYVEGKGLLDMVKENLIAERIAVESYSEMIAYIGDKDPTTRRLLEDILAQEEEHAEDMLNFLNHLDPKTTDKQESKSDDGAKADKSGNANNNNKQDKNDKHARS